MKVLKDRSRFSELWPMQRECRRCDSMVEIELSDIQYGRWKVGGYWFAGTEEIEDHYTWDCPACKHGFNPIDKALIPEGTKQDAIAAYQAAKAAGKPII